MLVVPPDINNGNVEGGSVEIVDDLTSSSVLKALSANQGRVLNEKIEGIVNKPQDIDGGTF